MTDSTWWAFIAGIDKQQLIRELPGSADDRRMRREHAAHVEELRQQRDAHEKTLGPSRQRAAEENSRGWTTRRTPPRELTQTERDIAAYAARKRGHAT